MLLNRLNNLRTRVFVVICVSLVASPIVLGMLYFRDRMANSLEREQAYAKQREVESFQEGIEQSLAVIELQVSAIAGDSDMHLASRSVLFVNNGLFLMESVRKRNSNITHLALLEANGHKIAETGSSNIPATCQSDGWRVEKMFALFCTPIRGYQASQAYIVGMVSLSDLIDRTRMKSSHDLLATIVTLESDKQARPITALPKMGIRFSKNSREGHSGIDREMTWLGFWIALSFVSLTFLMTWLFRLEQRSARLEHERTRKELHALRARLNPHFLFNALNSIVNSIEVNPKQAAEMVAGLSTLYRKVTNSTLHDTHSLRDELEIVDLYLEIESLRFGDRLHWRKEIPSTFLATSVPTLSLHLLVENAIKHGISKNRDGGEIVIVVNNAKKGWIRISVTNTGANAATRLALGTGLDTLQNTLRVLYGENSSVDLNSKENEKTVAEFVIPEGSP